LAFELNRPDIRRVGIDDGVDEDEEDEEADDVEDATGGSGLAPDIDDRPLLAPLGDVCVLTGGESGEVDGKLENALICELVDPDDPLPDDVASIGDSELPLPIPPGDACFEGAEKALDEDRLEDPPPLLAGCPDVAEGEGCSVEPGLVADLPFAFLFGSVATFGSRPPGRFLLLSPPPPLPLPPLPPPALNMGPPDAPESI